MKLLFVCNNLEIGGIQKSLINLLKELSDTHDVTLFMFYPCGNGLRELSKLIRLKAGNRWTEILGMSQAQAKKEGKFAWIWRSFWVAVTRVLGSRCAYIPLTKMQKIKEEYDCAVSFMQNSAYRYFYGGCNEFVINCVKAKKKIAFIHCDFKNYFGNNAYNRKYYKHFDKIACVSQSCKEVFDAVCPDCKNKTAVVHNCYDFKEMGARATEIKVQKTIGAVNLFTAARISEEKGIFRMIPILARLKQKGCRFVWRIAGDGSQMKAAQELCAKLEMENEIVFLGMLTNPYPYFKGSDMLLVPSYNEAAPMVYGEAMFFGLPVFTTETTSAREMIEKNGAGFVCKNDDASIEKDLGYLLEEPSRISIKKTNECRDNSEALQEFNALLV